MEVCRAITFINYHIPITMDNRRVVQYSTLGFFDGMMTEKIEICKERQELIKLWYYGLEETAMSGGHYSFQNIFCFSKDDWNTCTDEYMWSEDTDKKYPLTFVVFFQLRNYASGNDSISSKCRKFNNILSEVFQSNEGIYYTYGTIDKNDFVVCLKCKDYRKAVDSIKKMHLIDDEVIYSYSVFSVSNLVLDELGKADYQFLFFQTVDSISLKGITNSYDPQKEITLDAKYNKFCRNVISNLYPEDNLEDLEKKGQFKIYDILGENDFRLIAYNVSLGGLLKEFAKGGSLCYEENSFRFFLFSSKLVINILPCGEVKDIPQSYKRIMESEMHDTFVSPRCDELQSSMKNISKIVLQKSFNYETEGKVAIFCHAIWQLLQSMKSIETAPTKNYDFESLYKPFSLFVRILEEKMEEAQKDGYGIAELSENQEVYEFIHKISMTLHGTLRTDIQFFQVKDFNVTVHYAPAKLRAFYSIWAMQLSDYYNMFNEEEHEYSFIFSPGMFPQIGVRQLFMGYNEKSRLMLITVPERLLYSPANMSIILAHEVSHFVGTDVRCRRKRHFAILNCLVRLLVLEWNFLRVYVCKGKYNVLLEHTLSSSDLQKKLMKCLEEEEKIAQKKYDFGAHIFHSKNSYKIISTAFFGMSQKHLKKLIMDECSWINEKMLTKFDYTDVNKYVTANEIKTYAFAPTEQMFRMFEQFMYRLPQIFQVLKYITSEAFADLSAVLTLGLSPRDYILSFVQNEAIAQDSNNPFIVRISLVIQAITIMVKESDFIALGEKFTEQWKRNVFCELPFQFEDIPLAENIAVRVYGYVKDVENNNHNKISNYASLYNYSEKEFSNTVYGFLNDKAVWETLSGYIGECAKLYANILSSNDSICERKQQIVQTFLNMSGPSGTDILQEIESFLAHFAEKN